MNQYGAQVQRHYEQHLPQRYAELTDPITVFTEIGQQIQDLVQQRTDTLTQQYAQENPPGRSYTQRYAQMQSARSTAEQITMAEFLPNPEQ